MQRTYKYPFFVHLKKHYCPRCSANLEIITISKKVNSNSLEARHFNFYAGDVCLYGDVLFIWEEFRCPKCGKHISVEEMRRIEKDIKKQAYRLDAYGNNQRNNEKGWFNTATSWIAPFLGTQSSAAAEYLSKVSETCNNYTNTKWYNIPTTYESYEIVSFSWRLHN